MYILSFVNSFPFSVEEFPITGTIRTGSTTSTMPSPGIPGDFGPVHKPGRGMGQALNVRFDSLSEEEIQRGQSYFVSLPSVYIAAHVDYMRTVRILPLAPEETEIAVEWLFLPQAMAQDDFDRRNITDFATLVMEQDADASEINQRGIRSRKYRQGVLMPEEYHVKNFQDWVRTTGGSNRLT